MSDKTKDARITFRLTGREQARLVLLAKQRGIKPSALIRQAVANLLRRAA